MPHALKPEASAIPSAAKTQFNVAKEAQENGVRLTKTEIQLLSRQLDKGNNGNVSMEEFRKAGQDAMEKQWARELCLTAVEQPTTAWDRVGTKLLFVLDHGGKTLFAIVGTQIAGDAGMNLVGCVLVGCISCMGGGTLNNLLYGRSPLLDRTGVTWVSNPLCFYLAVAASVLTFFGWPWYCREQAKKELRDVFGKANLERDGSVGKQAFVRACQTDASFKESVAVALGVDPVTTDPVELFGQVDSDHSGYIEIDEMQHLIGKRFDASLTMYALDTISLSALAVVGVNQAISRGITPLVAATSGVTICFGGILRDVLCGRDLAVGGQSYAVATGTGSAVYILLRELSIRGIMTIPLVGRILLAAGATTAMRIWEYVRSEPLLRPMHHETNQAKREKAKTVLQREREARLERDCAPRARRTGEVVEQLDLINLRHQQPARKPTAQWLK